MKIMAVTKKWTKCYPKTYKKSWRKFIPVKRETKELRQKDLVEKFKELNENDIIGSVEIIQKNQVQIKSSMIGPWSFSNALFQGNFLRNFKNWFLLKIVAKNKHRTYTVNSEFFFIYCHRNSCLHLMS